MAKVGLEAKFRWKFGEAIGHVHFNSVVLAATLVRPAECAAIRRAGEGEELEKSVAQTSHRTVRAINCSVGVASFASVCIGLADDLLGDLDEAVKDVADGAAKLAR